MRLAAIIGTAALAVGLFSAPSQAQTKQQLDWCNGDAGATPDLQISGCSAVIQSGRFTGKFLAFAFNRRGKGYYLNKNYDRAIADYNQAIRLDPAFDVAYTNRGNAYYMKNAYDTAIADYNQAIRLKPKHAPYYINRGNAYFEKKDYDRAIGDYSVAARLNPKDTTAVKYRAQAMDAKKKQK